MPTPVFATEPADLIGKVVEEVEERRTIEAIIDLRTADLSGAIKRCHKLD
jgi:hypothetical protein